jgi:molecular chaperone GrpE
MKKARAAQDDPPVATEREDVESSAGAEEMEGPIAEDGAGAPDGALDQLRREHSALNDRYLRLAAEYSNYRRRAETDLSEAWGRGQAEMVRRFLDVLDDLQRISALDPTAGAVSVQTVVDGIDMVERKFKRALEDAGVEVVEPAGGDPFDPATMEAVMRVPAESPGDDDTVHQAFQKGYRFRNHLVRPARVSVRKHE